MDTTASAGADAAPGEGAFLAQQASAPTQGGSPEGRCSHRVQLESIDHRLESVEHRLQTNQARDQARDGVSQAMLHHLELVRSSQANSDLVDHDTNSRTSRLEEGATVTLSQLASLVESNASLVESNASLVESNAQLRGTVAAMEEGLAVMMSHVGSLVESRAGDTTILATIDEKLTAIAARGASNEEGIVLVAQQMQQVQRHIAQRGARPIDDSPAPGGNRGALGRPRYSMGGPTLPSQHLGAPSHAGSQPPPPPPPPPLQQPGDADAVVHGGPPRESRLRTTGGEVGEVPVGGFPRDGYPLQMGLSHIIPFPSEEAWFCTSERDKYLRKLDRQVQCLLTRGFEMDDIMRTIYSGLPSYVYAPDRLSGTPSSLDELRIAMIRESRCDAWVFFDTLAAFESQHVGEATRDLLNRMYDAIVQKCRGFPNALQREVLRQKIGTQVASRVSIAEMFWSYFAQRVFRVDPHFYAEALMRMDQEDCDWADPRTWERFRETHVPASRDMAALVPTAPAATHATHATVAQVAAWDDDVRAGITTVLASPEELLRAGVICTMDPVQEEQEEHVEPPSEAEAAQEGSPSASTITLVEQEQAPLPAMAPGVVSPPALVAAPVEAPVARRQPQQPEASLPRMETLHDHSRKHRAALRHPDPTPGKKIAASQITITLEELSLLFTKLVSLQKTRPEVADLCEKALEVMAYLHDDTKVLYEETDRAMQATRL